MKATSAGVVRIYLVLTLLYTLAASFIWGVNTLFLLDAGLNNAQAFAANAFFTLGQVLFEVPTGIVADTLGRRTSYLIGTITLAISTLLYLSGWYTHASMWWWAISSILLGLGFTFFSGATEAWLVDALAFTKYKGSLESVFAKAQIVGGIAMLTGSVAGGLIAQFTNIGVPYIVRAAVLGLTFVVAFFWMKDLGFTPKPRGKVLKSMKETFTTSIQFGFKNPSIRWIMLASPWSVGVSFYAFYAMQPFLLKLYGDPKAYMIAGLAAAIVAGAQIVGGITVPYIKNLFSRRTSVLLTGVIVSTVLLLLLGFTTNFYIAIALLIVWGLVSAATAPVRQSYLNGLIPSEQRATVLSFDSLIGSSGGIFIQPVLGRVADVWSYPLSYSVGAAFQIIALPFIVLAQKRHPKADTIT
ncbi:MAG: MFS transporter [Candidatus Woesebacteria bacterium]